MTPKTKTLVGATLGALVIIGFVAGVFMVSNKYLSRENKETEQVCTTPPTDYRVIVQDGKAVPEDTQAKLCDTLTLINRDNRIRLMAFGIHEDHVVYDGIEEKVLKEGESFTVTLVQAGSFKFHDHVDDQAQGTFTVTGPAL